MRDTSATLIDDIVTLYQTRGSAEYFGEAVSQLEHALQCAMLAERNDGDDALITAALLHDIGHLLGMGAGEDEAHDMKHETLAASYLSAAFGEEIVEPIRLHVRAKRFLCWADFAYEESLSDASRESLVAQGGPYEEEEALAFGKTPFSDQAIKVRIFDDHAKTPGLATPDLAHFLEAARRCAL